jgi:hypothetical protein
MAQVKQAARVVRVGWPAEQHPIPRSAAALLALVVMRFTEINTVYGLVFRERRDRNV